MSCQLCSQPFEKPWIWDKLGLPGPFQATGQGNVQYHFTCSRDRETVLENWMNTASKAIPCSIGLAGAWVGTRYIRPTLSPYLRATIGSSIGGLTGWVAMKRFEPCLTKQLKTGYEQQKNRRKTQRGYKQPEKSSDLPNKQSKVDALFVMSEGHRCFKERKYEEAVEHYTQYLNIPNISSSPKELITLFYCKGMSHKNLDQSYLGFANLQLAQTAFQSNPVDLDTLQSTDEIKEAQALQEKINLARKSLLTACSDPLEKAYDLTQNEAAALLSLHMIYNIHIQTNKYFNLEDKKDILQLITEIISHEQHKTKVQEEEKAVLQKILPSQTGWEIYQSGLSHYQRSAWEEAIASFDVALCLVNDKDLQKQIQNKKSAAFLHLKVDQPDPTASAYLPSDFAQNAFDLGKLYLEGKNHKEAIKYYTLAYQKAGSDLLPAVCYHLGIASYRLKDKKKAITYLSEAEKRYNTLEKTKLAKQAKGALDKANKLPD